VRIALVLFLLAGCRNDAITYMHAIDPSAECIASNTSGGGTRVYIDTATCVSRGHAFACRAPSEDFPHCEDRGPVVVENSR